MDNVLFGVPHQQCLVYLDDLLLHVGTCEEALDSLLLVLGSVAAAGFKLHTAARGEDQHHYM